MTKAKVLIPSQKDLAQVLILVLFLGLVVCFSYFQCSVLLQNQMGCSWSESEQGVSETLCLALLPENLPHAHKAFPLFFPGHQVCRSKTVFKALKPQIERSSIKMFFFLLPAPSQPLQGTSPFWPLVSESCFIRLYNCQNVYIVQLRGRRENKRQARTQGNKATMLAGRKAEH